MGFRTPTAKVRKSQEKSIFFPFSRRLALFFRNGGSLSNHFINRVAGEMGRDG
jgi:hypothetical protein